jgi:hypothetical protein
MLNAGIIRKSVIICLILLATISIMSKQTSAMEAHGTVTPYGIDFCMQGSHWLINGCDGSKVNLQSSTINLDMFLDQYVRVEGEDVGVECIVIEVVNIEMLPEPICATLTISPSSGKFVTTQHFDLTLIIEVEGLPVAVVGGSAALDGSDVTGVIANCVKPGTLISGGLTFRCPGLTGGLLGTGTHTLDVTLDLSDGSSVSDSVTWEVKENTEP